MFLGVPLAQFNFPCNHMKLQVHLFYVLQNKLHLFYGFITSELLLQDAFPEFLKTAHKTCPPKERPDHSPHPKQVQIAVITDFHNNEISKRKKEKREQKPRE